MNIDRSPAPRLSGHRYPTRGRTLARWYRHFLVTSKAAGNGLIIGVGLFVAALLLVATRHGLGVSTDSIAYLSSATSLLQEGRLLVPNEPNGPMPLTRFPPLYPLLLSALSLLAESAPAAARIAGAALLAVNVGLIGVVAGRSSHPLVGVAAAGFAAASLPVVEPHAWVWSEPLLLTGFLGLVLALAHLLSRGGRLAHVTIAALLAVLVLTRYAGVGLVGGAVLAVTIWGRGQLGARLLTAGSLLLLALFPLIAWFALIGMAGGSVGGRGLGLHPPGIPQFMEATRTVAGWLLPAPLPVLPVLILAVSGLGIACVLGFRTFRRTGDTNDVPSSAASRQIPRDLISAVLVLLAAMYVLFIVASFTLFDGDIPFDDRILLPVFCAFFIVAIRVTGRIVFMPSPSLRVRTSMILTTFVMVWLLHGAVTVRFLSRVHTDGLGYAAVGWRDSQTVAWVRDHSDIYTMFSNYADGLIYQTDERIAWLPWQGDPNRGIAIDPAYPVEMERLRQRVLLDDARIVLFRRQRRLLPDSSDIASLRGVGVIEVLQDGIIWGPMSSPPDAR